MMEIYRATEKNMELEGKPCRMRYALLTERLEDRTRYGVSVCNETTGEQTIVPDALLDAKVGEILLEKIVSGGVTPLTLREVVEDFVAEI